VADPARPEALAALDPRDGQRVARDDGDPQVGAEHLRHRAHNRPSTVGAVDGDVGSAGHPGDVVVLDVVVARLALAPTLGTQLLSVSPPATMLAAAGVALAAGVSALALERDLPAAIRLTPRPAASTEPA
jgi:hypothetical protein